MKFEKIHVVTLAISLVIGLAFSIAKPAGLLEGMYESGLDWRFKFWRDRVDPESTWKGIRDAISKKTPEERTIPNMVIIGIDSETLENVTEWPLPRNFYAQALESLTPQEPGPGPAAVLVDIMFQTKQVNESKKLLSLVDKKDKKFSKKVKEIYNNNDKALNKALKKMTTVSTDYPFYTTNDAFLYNKKRSKLIKKFAIPNENVTDEPDLPPWVDFPSPPIKSVTKTGQVPGFANIRISEATGINRQVPLVAKWAEYKNIADVPKPENYDRSKAKAIHYLPNIDLVVMATYYNIDFKKDIEVVFGEHIKLKNIPPRTMLNAKGDPVDVMARPNDERTITIPIDDEGFMDINFVGGPFAFPDVGLHKFVSTYPEPGSAAIDLHENIVLMAMYYATGSTTAKDEHASPFHKKHAGIEHHANAINTIVSQDFLYHAGFGVNLLIYMLVALALGLVIPRISTVLGLAAFVGLSVIVFILALFLFEYFNYVTVLQSVLWEALFCFLVITLYRIVFEESNTKYIKQTFSKFVSKDVVNELLKDPDKLKLGGDKQEITVFFSDVRGFTTISEKLTPEELVAVLNDYLSVMTEIIIDSHGTIDKYIGDAIMAFWGAPVPTKDHAFRACVSAVAQLDALNRLKGKWKERYGVDIDIGIGLNTGQAVAGNMGSSHRMDYTLMGDTVNLGSRLEGSTKQYTVKIIISEFTYQQVKEKVIVRELDQVRVKGKTEPVVIYELLAIKDAYRQEADAIIDAAAVEELTQAQLNA